MLPCVSERVLKLWKGLARTTDVPFSIGGSFLTAPGVVPIESRNCPDSDGHAIYLISRNDISHYQAQFRYFFERWRVCGLRVEVRYSCGPVDGPSIDFRAESLLFDCVIDRCRKAGEVH